MVFCSSFRLPARFLFALILLTVAAVPLSAQVGSYSADKPIGAAAQQLPPYLANAGIEQRLGQPLPLSATFTDEAGHTGPLQTWFTGRPVVLALVYYKCIMLCPQVLHGLATGLHDSTVTAGRDYDVVVASIDPTDTPADAVHEKQQFLTEAGLTSSPNAVHFLTGPPASIAALTGAAGFHYVRVPGPDGKMSQFAHSSVVMFATADGRLSKYLSGIIYAPRDLRMAVLDASAHHISNPIDLVILYCCSYNPVVGKYSVSVLRILSLGGMVSLFAVIGMIYLLTRKPSGRTPA
jgi:protein SCO1/2